jgi:histone acetyltransferase 1
VFACRAELILLPGSSNSNDALHIHLVQPDSQGLKSITKFNPKFTYSIFGDEEQVFGYKGLRINLRFNACDMRPNVQIEYDKKFKAVGETEPTDIAAVLSDFLPKSSPPYFPFCYLKC